jgi:S1-C subfamily serine protease
MKNEMPKIPNSNHKLLKKGTKLVLSAATFGVVAAGSFQGVNYVVDNYNKQNTTVQSTNVLKTSSSTTSNVSAVAQNCMPSIVSITNVSVSDVQNYFSMYGNNSRSNPFTQQENTSVGSGVIINKKNGEIDILTNYHVIENAKTLTCTLADNTNVVATVKGVDEDGDLAVISIKTKDLSEDTLKQIAIATIGDSDKLQVGEQVVAIGNALGYGQSVTTGIVSATNRSVSTSSDTDKSQSYIQTDAAINPGNSGGALLNMSGELIGINSAKLSDTDVEGMGYAIAISDVKDSIDTMLQGKDVSTSCNTPSFSYYQQNDEDHESDSVFPFDFWN